MLQNLGMMCASAVLKGNKVCRYCWEDKNKPGTANAMEVLWRLHLVCCTGEEAGAFISPAIICPHAFRQS